jgi:hypothetical protein
MQSLVRKEVNDLIDAVEIALLEKFEKVESPVAHTFLPGIYIREIFMARGNKYTSKIHKFRHAYFVLRGSANVWVEGTGWQLIEAPYFGITEPGTRRVLDILEDMNWICVHSNPDDTEDLELIEERLIERHTNMMLNNIQSQQIEQ